LIEKKGKNTNKIMPSTLLPQPQTFSLFSSLTPELRDQIWREAIALPQISDSLHLYKRGCWLPRQLNPSDLGYHTSKDREADNELNLWLEFRTEMVQPVQFELPLAFVSHEARHITLEYLQNQDRARTITMAERASTHHGTNNVDVVDVHMSKPYPCFVRRFDMLLDTLYIDIDTWTDFIEEPSEIDAGHPVYNREFTIRPNVTRIAIPEAFLSSKHAGELVWLHEDYKWITTLLVIIDTSPDLTHDTSAVNGRWWELEDINEGEFVWDNQRQEFDSRWTGQRVWYGPLADALLQHTQQFIANGVSRFEVRPVRAVRRG
jgi:hypothetical protein